MGTSLSAAAVGGSEKPAESSGVQAAAVKAESAPDEDSKGGAAESASVAPAQAPLQPPAGTSILLPLIVQFII